MVELTPEARAELDGYLAEQTKKSRKRLWTIVGSVIVGNLALLGTMYASVKTSARDAAVVRALEYVTSEASDVRSSLDAMDTIAKEQLAAVIESVGSAREAMGSLTQAHDTLASRLSVLKQSASQAEQAQATVTMQLRSLGESISEDRKRAEQLQAQLYEDIAGNLGREKARLAGLVAQIESLQKAVTGLAGEEGRVRLSRFRVLAEELAAGEPADVLLGTLTRVSKLEDMVSNGFDTLTCRSLVVRNQAQDRIVVIAADESGGSVSIFVPTEEGPIARLVARRTDAAAMGGLFLSDSNRVVAEFLQLDGEGKLTVRTPYGWATGLGITGPNSVGMWVGDENGRIRYAQSFSRERCEAEIVAVAECASALNITFDTKKPVVRLLDSDNEVTRTLK